MVCKMLSCRIAFIYFFPNSKIVICGYWLGENFKLLIWFYCLLAFRWFLNHIYKTLRFKIKVKKKVIFIFFSVFQLEMEDNDTIDVFQQQTGGREVCWMTGHVSYLCTCWVLLFLFFLLLLDSFLPPFLMLSMCCHVPAASHCADSPPLGDHYCCCWHCLIVKCLSAADTVISDP